MTKWSWVIKFNYYHTYEWKWDVIRWNEISNWISVKVPNESNTE